MTEIKKTALNAVHREAGGKMVEYAGWDMPVTFAGTIEEHNNVRTKVGIFDVGHMGEIEIKGPKALDMVQKISTNDASKLAAGQAHYSALTYPEGTFVDDMLVHKMDDDHFFLCVNAGNMEKDYKWIAENRIDGSEIINSSDYYAQISVQGPSALNTLKGLADIDISTIKYYWFSKGRICGRDAIIARTGYTGEDGFELYIAQKDAVPVWKEVMKAGEPFGIQPIGLAARDTLRLEAGMCLYGNDMDDKTTVLEADLKWIVKLDKGDFMGRDVLVQQNEEGVEKILAGFELTDKGIARHGYPVFYQGKEAGIVTSGTHAPFLEKSIGMAHVPPEAATPGTAIEIEIRGRKVKAVIVKKPFYKRSK